MKLNIEIPDDLASALNEQAQNLGVSPECLASRLVQSNLIELIDNRPPGRGFETGFGTWAKFGQAPSAEEIDKNRREMFRNFASHEK
jgi:hypothetical protein